MLRATMLGMLALSTTIAVSELAHRYIEIPSIVFGRWAQRLLLQRFAEPAPGNASR